MLKLLPSPWKKISPKVEPLQATIPRSYEQKNVPNAVAGEIAAARRDELGSWGKTRRQMARPAQLDSNALQGADEDQDHRE